MDGLLGTHVGRTDDGPSGRAASQFEGQRARVDAFDRRDPGFHEELLDRNARAARRGDQPGHDQGTGVDPVRFEVGSVDPVVPDHRMSQDHDLAGERGIGQDLAPAGGRGREDQVTLGRPVGAAQLPGMDPAAFERQQART